MRGFQKTSPLGVLRLLPTTPPTVQTVLLSCHTPASTHKVVTDWLLCPPLIPCSGGTCLTFSVLGECLIKLITFRKPLTSVLAKKEYITKYLYILYIHILCVYIYIYIYCVCICIDTYIHIFVYICIYVCEVYVYIHILCIYIIFNGILSEILIHTKYIRYFKTFTPVIFLQNTFNIYPSNFMVLVKYLYFTQVSL